MKKLPGPLNVDFVNRTFFPDHKDVATINKGKCFLWAYIAFNLYNNLELCDMGAHAFVRDKGTGKFYDSERPQGEADWKDLPATNFGLGCGCNICSQGLRKRKDIKRYKNSWRGMVKLHKVDWSGVDAKIHLVIEQNT